jgi:hypothetical protein
MERSHAIGIWNRDISVAADQLVDDASEAVSARVDGLAIAMATIRLWLVEWGGGGKRELRYHVQDALVERRECGLIREAVTEWRASGMTF